MEAETPRATDRGGPQSGWGSELGLKDEWASVGPGSWGRGFLALRDRGNPKFTFKSENHEQSRVAGHTGYGTKTGARERSAGSVFSKPRVSRLIQKAGKKGSSP